VVEYLRYQAARYTNDIVGARLSYDLDYLAQMGVDFPCATFKDVQVAEPLLDELQRSYSLAAILERYGLEPKDETLLRQAADQFKLDPKNDLWRLPARYVGPYAEADAALPLQLLERQEPELERQGLLKAWKLECEVLPVLVRMRRRGVRIDFDNLDRMDRWSRAEETMAWGELQRLTGVAVAVGDAMKAEVVAATLKAIGIQTPITANTKRPSITKEWLESLEHPAGKVIRRARKMSQLRTTFINSIRAHEVKGRVHCTFNQTVSQDDDGDPSGAAYGRLSCVDPNLQQQPARDPEIGPAWRATYLPDEGGQWGQLDYSQQEPGLALHFAVASGPTWIGEAAHRSALEAAQRKREDPSMDYHTMFTAMVHGDHVLTLPKGSKELKALRDPAKNTFLGIVYGMGGPKLCRTLGYPTKTMNWI
jgi:DNA polymerase I-like protein with 3'-5' exonuclease and polymerase domains